MHDFWPATNSSDLSAASLSQHERSKTMFPLTESSSFEMMYDAFCEDSLVDINNAALAESTRKRIRRRCRRRKNGRSVPIDLLTNDLSEKNDEDYTSDDYAEELSSSQSTNSSNPSGSDMLATQSLPSLDNIDVYGQSNNYQLNLGQTTNKLRPIIVDGTNVALCHGNADCYSYQGIQLCIEWFKKRGHTDIKVILPSWHVDANSSLLFSYRGKEILAQPELSKHLLYTNSTPSDRQYICGYIINLAIKSNAIVVSNDRYGDVTKNDSELKKMVYERLLSFVFTDDQFTPPDTPLGRYGPTIDVFLQHNNRSQFAQICPYKSRCTYGNKCRYYHPESTSAYFAGTHPAAAGTNYFNSLPIFNKRTSQDYFALSNNGWSSTNRTNSNCSNRPKLGMFGLESGQSFGSNASLPYPLSYASALSFDPTDRKNTFEDDANSSDQATRSSGSSPSDIAVDCVENLWKNDSAGCNLMSTLSSGLDKEKTRYLIFCRLCSFYPCKVVKQAMDELPLETGMHVLDSRVKMLLDESK